MKHTQTHRTNTDQFGIENKYRRQKNETKTKKAETTILISEQITFSIKKVIKDRDWHYSLVKGTIVQEIPSTEFYTKWRLIKTHVSTHEPKEVHWQKHNCSGRYQHPLL